MSITRPELSRRAAVALAAAGAAVFGVTAGALVVQAVTPDGVSRANLQPVDLAPAAAVTADPSASPSRSATASPSSVPAATPDDRRSTGPLPAATAGRGVDDRRAATPRPVPTPTSGRRAADDPVSSELGDDRGGRTPTAGATTGTATATPDDRGGRSRGGSDRGPGHD